RLLCSARAGPGIHSFPTRRSSDLQQLHLYGGEHGLLRLPSGGLAEHHDTRWSGTESRHGGVSDLAMLDVPQHEYMDVNLQPRNEERKTTQLNSSHRTSQYAVLYWM